MELDEMAYDMISHFDADMLFRYGYITAYDKRYIKDITQYKRTCLKIINSKYYLIMVIKPEPTNAYIDLSNNDNSIANPENFRKFCEWADRVIKGIEDEKN